MIEHDRHGRGGDEVLDRGDHRKRGEQLHVPAARLYAFDRGGEARPADVRIIDAAGREIEADAAKAVLSHRVEIGFRRLVVDHGDAARGRRRAPSCRTAWRNCRPVNARRHDHHALAYAAPCAAPPFPRARRVPAYRRGRRRTEIFRDRRGCGCGNRRRPQECRNSPASRAALPWRMRFCCSCCSWSLPPRWKRRQAEYRVASAWSSPCAFLGPVLPSCSTGQSQIQQSRSPMTRTRSTGSDQFRRIARDAGRRFATHDVADREQGIARSRGRRLRPVRGDRRGRVRYRSIKSASAEFRPDYCPDGVRRPCQASRT